MSDLSFEGLPNLPQVKMLAAVAALLWDDPSVAILWLEGSFARGEADIYSDIDLRLAVVPELIAQWRNPDFTHLLGDLIVDGRSRAFGETTFLHQFVLTGGTILDLWVQNTEQPPPAPPAIALGSYRPSPPSSLVPARPDPPLAQQILIDFWLCSLKHRKVLYRGLDLLTLTGIQYERVLLQRLWHLQATGRDFSPGETIHTLTDVTRTIAQWVGNDHALTVLGAPLNSRATIYTAIEMLHDEVSASARSLAESSPGFVYPDRLEAIVRDAWQQFRTAVG